MSENFDPHVPPFKGSPGKKNVQFSRSLEPIEIDRQHMTSYYEPVSYRFRDKRGFFFPHPMYLTPPDGC